MSQWVCTILTTRSEASPNPAFNFALQRGWPLYLSTKDTILKAYDGRFRDIYQAVYESEFAEEFKKRNLTLREPLDRRHGGAGVKMERRLCLGVQEL